MKQVLGFIPARMYTLRTLNKAWLSKFGEGSGYNDAAVGTPWLDTWCPFPALLMLNDD
jgi:hypothetical protein